MGVFVVPCYPSEAIWRVVDVPEAVRTLGSAACCVRSPEDRFSLWYYNYVAVHYKAPASSLPSEATVTETSQSSLKLAFSFCWTHALCPRMNHPYATSSSYVYTNVHHPYSRAYYRDVVTSPQHFHSFIPSVATEYTGGSVPTESMYSDDEHSSSPLISIGCSVTPTKLFDSRRYKSIELVPLPGWLRKAVKSLLLNLWGLLYNIMVSFAVVVREEVNKWQQVIITGSLEALTSHLEPEFAKECSSSTQ
ncbi:hypothetical protein BU15DRAFT_63415 [Melanogaster broomeanus]|nr:hypothetical protein BU15DRAFT_63415 [Melanogaster broomeanus]